MKHKINLGEHLFAFAAISTIAAGLVSTGAMRAELEYEESFHDAAKDECIQMEGTLRAIEREKEEVGCYHEETPQECDGLWERMKELSDKESDCYRHADTQREDVDSACRQMNEVLIDIEEEKEALDCFSNDAPAECDDLTRKFEEQSQVIHDCYQNIESQQTGSYNECEQMGQNRIAMEQEVDSMGCHGTQLPTECDALWQKYDDYEWKVRDCYDRIESRQPEYDGRKYQDERRDFPPPPPPWRGDEGRPGNSPAGVPYPDSSDDCYFVSGKLHEVKTKAQEVCFVDPNNQECQFLKEVLEEIAKESEHCAQSGDVGRPNQPPPPWREGNKPYPTIPPPWDGEHDRPYPPTAQPWEGALPRIQMHQGCDLIEEELQLVSEKARRACTGSDDECRRYKEAVSNVEDRLRRCMQPGSTSDGGYMPPSFPGREYDRLQFQEERRDEYLDVMIEERFYDIMSQARERLHEALSFVEGDMAYAIEEAIDWLDEIEKKFESDGVRPTHEDIDNLIHRLEKVKRSMDESMHQYRGEDRMREDSREHFDDDDRPDRRPPRDADEIVEELSMVIETLIPRVFEIFEEEGEGVPDSARESYEEALAVFKDVLPICRGGEMQRRVCAAAMQEVMQILEENMRPFVEKSMMSNDRLRERIEKLFGEFEDEHEE